MKFVILLAILQIALGYKSDLPCPERPVMQNFDIKRIEGTWYNVMQYEDEYAQSFLCGHGNYSKHSDHSMKVHECEKRESGKYECLTGIISLNEPNRIRSEGKTSYAYLHAPHEKVDEFKYLAVDYNEYAVVYDCKDKPEGKSLHSLWIASRTPQLSKNAKKKVDELIEQHFDRRAIKTVVQSRELCEPRHID